MESAENTGKSADFFDGHGSPSPKKPTPKQIKENFEKILNVRKRQHWGLSDDEDGNKSGGEELIKHLRQKCFNLEIENENLS